MSPAELQARLAAYQGEIELRFGILGKPAQEARLVGITAKPLVPILPYRFSARHPMPKPNADQPRHSVWLLLRLPGT